MTEIALTTEGQPLSGSEEFGMRVVLHGPAAQLNLLRVIKPLFDGIIAALQVDDGRSPDEGLAIHARDAGLSIPQATQRLRDNRQAVLGRTKLLKRDGLMQPSDDLCVLGELSRDPAPTTHWHCSGEVFRVTPLS